MTRNYEYIKYEEGEKHLYKILGNNMTLYIKRLKDTPANRKKIKSRGSDLYMMGKCDKGFGYVSTLWKLEGSEKDFKFDYNGKKYLMSLRDKAIIRGE